MNYVYNGTNIYYKFHNKTSIRPILLLHGWGCDGTIFDDLIKKFPEKSFLTVDFPPFGKSDKDIKNWNIFTYASMLMSLLDFLHIDKSDILCHSFGGRVALLLCGIKCSYVGSCIFVDSAGLKPKRSLKYYHKVLKYKINKKLGKSTLNMGSKDYLALSPNMRPIFNSIVNTHLDDYCRFVDCKTLIVWGKKDKETPLYMAKRLNKKIKGSTLKIIEEGGHFSFIDCPFEFYRIVKEFWEDLWYM